VPADDEVLIKVHATTVNRTDCGFRDPKPFFVRAFSGLRRPKHQILGTEVAGEVEAVGAAVTELAVGDRVFGVNANRFGTHAEYVCMREKGPLATMPPGITFEQAAAIPDGVVLALANLRKAKLSKGQRILIYGASGSIGTAGVQLAKHLGAHVTAVCSTDAVELVRSLGADEVIDYTTTDFTATGEVYDVVFDAVGKTSFRKCRPLIKERGSFVSTDLGPLWQNPFLGLLTAKLPVRKVSLPIPAYSKQDVLLAKDLLAAGSYRPVIDRTYPLEEVVAATRYVETQQKKGNVVLTVTTGHP
jgi:NADPH:quinone reductase-like Zn-dependent oxidoreductase